MCRNNCSINFSSGQPYTVFIIISICIFSAMCSFVVGQWNSMFHVGYNDASKLETVWAMTETGRLIRTSYTTSRVNWTQNRRKEIRNKVRKSFPSESFESFPVDWMRRLRVRNTPFYTQTNNRKCIGLCLLQCEYIWSCVRVTFNAAVHCFFAHRFCQSRVKFTQTHSPIPSHSTRSCMIQWNFVRLFVRCWRSICVTGLILSPSPAVTHAHFLLNRLHSYRYATIAALQNTDNNKPVTLL